MTPEQLPPPPSSPVLVCDLFLRMRTYAKSLGWGEQEMLYPKHEVQAYATAATAALRAELDALRRDAERYRHLREHGDIGCTEKDGYGGQTLRMGEDLDAVVDAAMKEAP